MQKPARQITPFFHFFDRGFERFVPFKGAERPWKRRLACANLRSPTSRKKGRGAKISCQKFEPYRQLEAIWRLPMITWENDRKWKFWKKSIQEKKGKGAKPPAEKKRLGGKNLMSEISVLTAIRGYMAPPDDHLRKWPKMKILKKIHARKKKARGQNLMQKTKGRGAKIECQKFRSYQRLEGIWRLPHHHLRKWPKMKISKKIHARKKKAGGQTKEPGGGN